jgi:hypothetical protein
MIASVTKITQGLQSETTDIAPIQSYPGKR